MFWTWPDVIDFTGLWALKERVICRLKGGGQSDVGETGRYLIFCLRLQDHNLFLIGREQFPQFDKCPRDGDIHLDSLIAPQNT